MARAESRPSANSALISQLPSPQAMPAMRICHGNQQARANLAVFCVFLYSLKKIPSETRTLEFVGPKMKTWFWGRCPKKTGL